MDVPKSIIIVGILLQNMKIHTHFHDDWADNYPRMASTYYNSNLIKYKFHGGNISEAAIGLHSDGRAFVDGTNHGVTVNKG